MVRLHQEVVMIVKHMNKQHQQNKKMNVMNLHLYVVKGIITGGSLRIILPILKVFLLFVYSC